MHISSWPWPKYITNLEYVLWACLANGCNCGIFVWIVIKSYWCDIKYKKVNNCFIEKWKRFCFVVYFFIWIIIKIINVIYKMKKKKIYLTSLK